MKAPCIDCEKKGCGSYHDECERYREYTAHREEVRKEKVRQRTINDNLKSVYLNKWK